MKRLLGLFCVGLIAICCRAEDKPIHVYAKVTEVGQDKAGTKGVVIEPVLAPSLELVLVSGPLPKEKDFVDCAAYAVEMDAEPKVQIIEMKCGETVFRVSKILFQQEAK